jgi:hypothetical protein
MSEPFQAGRGRYEHEADYCTSLILVKGLSGFLDRRLTDARFPDATSRGQRTTLDV